MPVSRESTSKVRHDQYKLEISRINSMLGFGSQEKNEARRKTGSAEGGVSR